MLAETNARGHIPSATSGSDQGMEKCKVCKENRSSYASYFRSTMHQTNVDKELKGLALGTLLPHDLRRPLVNVKVNGFDV